MTMQILLVFLPLKTFIFDTSRQLSEAFVFITSLRCQIETPPPLTTCEFRVMLRFRLALPLMMTGVVIRRHH
jgi:hypothetical protein